MTGFASPEPASKRRGGKNRAKAGCCKKRAPARARGRGPCAVRPRRAQESQRNQRGSTRGGRRADEDGARERETLGADQRQRGDSQVKRHRQGQRAERADPAILHDFELARSRRAAAETVGAIGETILMQRAGQRDENRDGERRGEGRGKSEGGGGEEGAGGDGAEDRADQRERAGRARKSLKAMRAGFEPAEPERAGASQNAGRSENR